MKLILAILSNDDSPVASNALNKNGFSVTKLATTGGFLRAGGSLTLAHSQNSQMSFMYGFFFVKFLFFTVVCVVIVV